jgi:hypothetical protein
MATHPAFEGAGAKKGIEIWRIEVSWGNQYGKGIDIEVKSIFGSKFECLKLEAMSIVTNERVQIRKQ